MTAKQLHTINALRPNGQSPKHNLKPKKRAKILSSFWSLDLIYKLNEDPKINIKVDKKISPTGAGGMGKPIIFGCIINPRYKVS